MKKKQILKSLIMILTIVFSVLSSLIVDSKLTITAHAASNYGLTVKWTEGTEWVATDEAGTNRWTNGSIKYFVENTSAGTYIKLKPGYRIVWLRILNGLTGLPYLTHYIMIHGQCTETEQ
jgi:hypothetical protein